MSDKPKRRNRKPSAQIDTTAPASIIVNDRFGGLARFCELTGLSTSTVWGWLLSGDVPPKRVPEIKAKAMAAKVKLKDSDFVRQLAAA
jgi:hypothetical protein